MQKYKVFINNHSILFSENAAHQHDLRDFVFEEEVIKGIVNQLLRQDKGIEKIVFLTSDIEKAWQFFQKCFKRLTAAGGIVENQKKEILFIHRLGVWDLPKGKMEKGETVKKTAVREVEEECGISPLKIITALPPTYHMYRQKGKLIFKKTHWFYMRYSGNQNLVPQKEESIEKAVWLNRKEIKPILAGTYESLKGLIEFFLASDLEDSNEN